MATFDVVTGGSVSDASTLTISHAAGTPTGVGAGLGTFDFDGRTLSTVTYGGTAMTQELAYNTANSDTWIHGLANPSSGTQDYVATFSGAVFRIRAGVVTVTDGSTADVFSNSAQATGTGTAAAVTVTSASGELVMDVCNTTDNQTVPGDQTERYNSGAVSGNTLAISTEGGAASVEMARTISSSKEWWMIGASFANAAAASGSKRLLLLGVGS